VDREQGRNGKPDRVSYFINRRPAVNVHHATRYADRLGLPLNRFVTINFSHTSCADKQASHAFRKLLTQRFAPWLRRSSGLKETLPPTYVWVLECGGGQACVHWLVHIPRSLNTAFERKIADWLTSLLGEAPAASTVKIKAIPNLIGLKRYVLKGVDPVWAKHLAVRHIDQGRVVGKRSGFSRNLGPEARKRGGYKARRFSFPIA
jgi:hypothetical protein